MNSKWEREREKKKAKIRLKNQTATKANNEINSLFVSKLDRRETKQKILFSSLSQHALNTDLFTFSSIIYISSRPRFIDKKYEVEKENLILMIVQVIYSPSSHSLSLSFSLVCFFWSFSCF